MRKDLGQLRQAYTHALLLAGRQWRRAADAEVERHGISDATALPLVLIGRMAGEPRQNALAEAVGIEGPSLVRLLDQLEKAGLVVRKEDPTDRRAKVLSLTPAGRSVVHWPWPSSEHCWQPRRASSTDFGSAWSSPLLSRCSPRWPPAR